MNVIGFKWVYHVKQRADGSLKRCKAPLVAKEFLQPEGYNYGKTFNPVIKFATVRAVFAVAVSSGWGVQQLDIHNAFLNGTFQGSVYMSQPPGFVDPS